MMLNALNRLFSSIPLFIVLFLVFILLNILDGHSTWKVIKPDNFHRERNPVARWIFRKLGIPRGIVAFKLALLGILGVAMGFYASHDVKMINIVLSVANVVFLIVVVHNYRVYARIRSRAQARKEFLS
jgi:hypothetical protein